MKSKRVLIVIPHLSIGGTEHQTLNTAKALIDAGYNVMVMCLYRCIPSTVESFQRIGVNVVLLSPQYNHYGLKIAYHKPLRLVKFLFCGLKQCISSFDPDVIHIQYMTPGATVILLSRYVFFRKNIIATAHTAADIYQSLGMLRWIARHLLVAFTCITERAEKSFFGSSQLYSPELKLKRKGNHFTIYNNLPSYISIAAGPRQFKGVVTIGVVSRLERIKGMDLVVPAFAKVHQAIPDTRLLIVGDGSLRSLMEKDVKENGLEDSVEFAGRQPQDVLQAYYDRIDILQMPSRSEGFGLTAIEGMARGCVVVAADTGGLPEVLGDAGLLHSPGSINDLAEKLMVLLSDRNRMQICSSLGLKRVSRFSTENYARLIADLYGKLTD